MAWIFTLSGNKGGVGRSTEATGLAYALARRGYEVGVADMDPQGNLTRRLGIDKNELLHRRHPGIAQMLDRSIQAKPDEVAVPCGWPDDGSGAVNRISVLPSLDRESLGLRADEASLPGAEGRLKRALRSPWTDGKHVVLIDTGPAVDHLLRMVLTATDRVILVCTPEYDPIEGALYLAHYIRRERENFERPDLDIAGVVVNNVDQDVKAAAGEHQGGSKTHRMHLNGLADTFCDFGGESIIWHPYIPHRKTLAASQDEGVPIEALRHTVARELLTIFDRHASRLIEITSAPEIATIERTVYAS